MKARKLITELYNHEKILAAIEKGDCQKLLFYLQSLEDLDHIDSKGKSLLAIIQESSIDINKSISDEYGNGIIITQTPLQRLFIIRSDNPLEKLQLLLTLGANVNNVLDSKGNNLLHQYVQRRNVHPTVLKMFLSAGGDFLKENAEGKTPIDLAPKEIAIYIKKLLAGQDKKQQDAIKIQRQWRSHSAKKTETKSHSPVELKHPLLNRIAEEPTENPPNEEKMQQWVDAHDEKHKETARKVVKAVQYISPKHFLFGLKMATKKFNKYLSSLPEADRNYVLVIDRREDKSGWWATKLAEKHLAFPPKNIITTEEILSFTPSEDCRHMVLIDDLSYSGNFFVDFLTQFREKAVIQNKSLINLQLHLVLPFVGEEAQARFKQFGAMLHCQETIPNFNVPGTVFTAKTATYPAHKNPDSTHSAIEAIDKGTSVDGKETGIQFVAPVTPPYKKKKL